MSEADERNMARPLVRPLVLSLAREMSELRGAVTLPPGGGGGGGSPDPEGGSANALTVDSQTFMVDGQPFTVT